jgi:hypothetical protein
MFTRRCHSNENCYDDEMASVGPLSCLPVATNMRTKLHLCSYLTVFVGGSPNSPAMYLPTSST